MLLHKNTRIGDFDRLFIKIFNFVWISNLLCMNVRDEGYLRNAEARRANDIYKDPRVIT
jgi:hypothetical protein